MGAIITNTAHIYSDFNEPIATNTTLNVISNGSSNIVAIKKGVDLLYPNPAYDKVQIRFKDALKCQVVIRNATGQLMLEQQVNGSETILNVAELAAGLYILEIKAEGAIYSASKFIVQH